MPGLDSSFETERWLQSDVFEEVYARRIGSGHKIMAIAWLREDPNNIRIAVSNNDRQIHAFIFGAGLGKTMTAVLGVQLENTIARIMVFDEKSSSRDLLVCGCMNGTMYVPILALDLAPADLAIPVSGSMASPVIKWLLTI